MDVIKSEDMEVRKSEDMEFRKNWWYRSQKTTRDPGLGVGLLPANEVFHTCGGGIWLNLDPDVSLFRMVGILLEMHTCYSYVLTLSRSCFSIMVIWSRSYEKII